MSSGAPASVTAVIAAAGSGERLGAGGPKALVAVAGRPLVAWSLAAFVRSSHRLVGVEVRLQPSTTRPDGSHAALTDMAANFSKIVELRGKWFTPPYPADTIAEVRSLYLPEVEIEIEAIAVRI